MRRFMTDAGWALVLWMLAVLLLGSFARALHRAGPDGAALLVAGTAAWLVAAWTAWTHITPRLRRRWTGWRVVAAEVAVDGLLVGIGTVLLLPSAGIWYYVGVALGVVLTNMACATRTAWRHRPPSYAPGK